MNSKKGGKKAAFLSIGNVKEIIRANGLNTGKSAVCFHSFDRIKEQTREGDADIRGVDASTLGINILGGKDALPTLRRSR